MLPAQAMCMDIGFGAQVMFGAGDPVASKGDCWPCLEAEIRSTSVSLRQAAVKFSSLDTFRIIFSADMCALSEAEVLQ